MNNEEYGVTPIVSEEEAIAYFHSVGRAEVKRQLDALSAEADARLAECFDRGGFWSLPGYTSFDFLTPQEKALRHKLQLALMLCIDEPAEAKARIAARLAQRRGRATKAALVLSIDQEMVMA